MSLSDTRTSSIPSRRWHRNSGADFRTINPKGYVATLELDDGQILTESAALLQYVADLRPEAGLAPEGGLARARLQEQLNFTSSELHKAFGPLFNPATSPEGRQALWSAPVTG